MTKTIEKELERYVVICSCNGAPLIIGTAFRTKEEARVNFEKCMQRLGKNLTSDEYESWINAFKDATDLDTPEFGIIDDYAWIRSERNYDLSINQILVPVTVELAD